MGIIWLHILYCWQGASTHYLLIPNASPVNVTCFPWFVSITDAARDGCMFCSTGSLFLTHLLISQ